MGRIVQLGSQPYLISGHAGGANPFADFLLVAVSGSGIDVTITGFQSGLDRFGDLIRSGLPGAKPNSWDLGSRVEGESAAISLVRMVLETAHS